MALPTYTQDPSDRLDYTMDWSAEMTALADTITLSEWSLPVSPVGLVIDGETNDTTTATAFLSGGAAGDTYVVANKITTAAGRIIERSLKLKLKEL